MGLNCLDWRYVCDGIEHCQLGEDELHCERLEENQCELNECRCRNGMCIPQECFFDGIRTDAKEGQNQARHLCQDFCISHYSLETPLYRALQSDADAYTSLLYFNLDQLEKCAFTGHTYRGATMTNDDLDAYHWAKNHSALLETRSLQSTSKDRNIAKNFSVSNLTTNERSSVIIHFIFNEICPTAIDLNDLSYFPDEEEVLLLPLTLFKAISIEEILSKSSKQYEITMENIPVPKKNIWKLSRNITKEN